MSPDSQSSDTVGERSGAEWAFDDGPEPRLALVVGAARSGTTLLRLLLDAHPEIGCPAEAGIPSVITSLGRVWWTLQHGATRLPKQDPQGAAEADLNRAGEEPGQGAEGNLPELAPEAENAIRRAVLAPMQHFCRGEGKSLYCDKSLDSVHHLPAVHQIFPGVRYILVFRHVMDTIASGLEASPFGFQAYGYLPFVERSPENFVAALMSYWLSHVDAAMHWEEMHPELCHRIRYEDLVSSPEDVLAGLFDFLGVDRSLSVLEQAFTKARTATGPGDYKVTFTDRVHSDSVGNGKRVPVGMVPPPLLEAANSKLTSLGYEPLTQAWNAEPLTRGDDHGGAWGVRLVELMRQAQNGLYGEERRGHPSVAVIAEDVDELRWIIDPASGTIRQGDGEVESAVTGTAQDLVLLLSGEANPGMLMRSGRIRHLTADDDARAEEVVAAMLSLVDIVRDGDAGANGLKLLSRQDERIRTAARTNS